LEVKSQIRAGSGKQIQVSVGVRGADEVQVGAAKYERSLSEIRQIWKHWNQRDLRAPHHASFLPAGNAA